MGERESVRGEVLHRVHGAYVEQRGRAQSASTMRLRWWMRRLPQHSGDQVTAARAKAVRDELAYRSGARAQ